MHLLASLVLQELIHLSLYTLHEFVFDKTQNRNKSESQVITAVSMTIFIYRKVTPFRLVRGLEL